MTGTTSAPGMTPPGAPELDKRISGIVTATKSKTKEWLSSG